MFGTGGLERKYTFLSFPGIQYKKPTIGSRVSERLAKKLAEAGKKGKVFRVSRVAFPREELENVSQNTLLMCLWVFYPV